MHESVTSAAQSGLEQLRSPKEKGGSGPEPARHPGREEAFCWVISVLNVVKDVKDPGIFADEISGHIPVDTN